MARDLSVIVGDRGKGRHPRRLREKLLASGVGSSREQDQRLDFRMPPRELDRVVHVDERIGIREYETAIRTYRQLIIEAASS